MCEIKPVIRLSIRETAHGMLKDLFDNCKKLYEITCNLYNINFVCEID